MWKCTIIVCWLTAEQSLKTIDRWVTHGIGLQDMQGLPQCLWWVGSFWANSPPSVGVSWIPLRFLLLCKIGPFWSHFRFPEVPSTFSHSAVVSRRPEAASFGGSRRPNQTFWYYTRFLFSGRMSDFCKNSLQTADHFSQWQTGQTKLYMLKSIFRIACSDCPVLQRGEPRDVLMDVEGWDSRETWGHIRGGGRGA